MLLEKIDTAHLNVLLSDDNSWWAWQLKDGKHWVTDRHVAIVVDADEAGKEEAGWELLDTLEHHFKIKSPPEGMTIVLYHGEITVKELDLTTVLKKFIASKSTLKGDVTPFIYAKDYYRYRLTKFADFNLFIQDKYISILYDAVNENIYADGPESPSFLCDGQLIILPIKNMRNEVEELNEFEKMISLVPFIL